MNLKTFTHWKASVILLCIDCYFFTAQSQPVSTPIEVKPAVSNLVVNPDLRQDDRFKLLTSKMRKFLGDTQKNWDEYEQVDRELISRFPDQPDGYEFLIDEILSVKHDKALSLAKGMSDSSAPEKFKLWAKGFLFRDDLMGKPVTLQFLALDGREVDLAKMKGKVVLIEFWATGCVPCVAELPVIKAVYDKYHTQGFEVIGISFDYDKARLLRFVKEKDLRWPQSFEGEQGVDNKFAREFGVCMIPHLLLLDKNGRLRNGDFHSGVWFDSGASFETTIDGLLKEPYPM